MRLGFTGTRKGMSLPQKSALEDILSYVDPDIVYHGGCVGADQDFHNICVRLRSKRRSHLPLIVVYPSDLKDQQCNWKGADVVMEEAPPLVRNEVIVRASNLLIAAPSDDGSEELRSGTWATIRYARSRGTPVTLLPRS